MKGDFPAGAVSQQTLEAMAGDGSLQPGQVRIFWSSPGYSHCCFTAQRATDQETYRQVQDALLSVRPTDPDGLAVLEAEGCSSFVAGMETGWEALEEAAVAEGLV
jgi:phosphonate transport system substrate-binding protein